ncbi:hypothetical protein IP88_08090 [alpha proteobacterium AAP81b]|nr:hypothetical protein IP88_08090 [alpha proteobacterium AAP81b]
MNSLFAASAALLLASTVAAHSQTTSQSTTTEESSAPGQAGSTNAAIKDRDPQKVTSPAKGANSFTEDQARARLVEAGYTVTRVSKQKDVWTGSGSKDGKIVTIMLDYKGNITTR